MSAASPSIEAITPILVVDTVEPSLPFWTALGFAAVATVPATPPYAFAMLSHGELAVMLQTRASVAEDTPAVGEAVQASVVYLRVADLDAILAALPEAPVAVARRTTFYGADEIFLRDPAGNVVGFAQFAPGS